MRIKMITGAVLIGSICASALSGCKETPKEDIIVQKESINKLVQENKAQADIAGISIRKAIHAPEHSSFVVEDEKLKLKIMVDADVVMPDVNQVPIIKMIRDDIPSSRLEEITKVVFGDNKVVPEKGGPVKYEYDHEDQYVVIGKDKDGMEKTLYVLNFPEESSANYSRNGSLTPIVLEAMATDENTDNQCKYSKEEAIKLTKDMARQLKLDKQYTLASVHYLINPDDTKGEHYTAKGYRIRYKRTTHGIMETDDATTLNVKRNEDHPDVPYGYEYMEFYIDDHGGMFWNWTSPMKEEAILSGNVNLLSYDKIMGIFKEQVKYSNANGKQFYYLGDMTMSKDDTDDGFHATVTRIIFGYMRVKNKGEETYSLVPVWDFQGDVNQGTSILTINAIDGTVIDRRLGY